MADTRTEDRVEGNCVKLARRAGGHLLKLVPWFETGLPDRLLLLPGPRVVFCEFKRPKGGTPRPKQNMWRRRLERLGFEFYFIRNEEQFKAVLEGRATPSHSPE